MNAQSYVLRGDLVYASVPKQLETIQNGYLVVVDGKIAGTFSDLPASFQSLPLHDHTGRLIFPALVDLHVHAPQFANTGLGLDYPLLPWLEHITFPEEKKFSDLGYARRVYRAFAKTLARQGSLRACVFATVHREATLVLMAELENAGVQAMVGKVNMDANSPASLMESTEESYAETLKWLEECRFSHVKPILTPRFAPSCTEELLTKLGVLAQERGLWVQSHLSENHDEIRRVAQLFPSSESYTQLYASCGLLNERTIMAHCIHNTPREQELLKQSGAVIAHCPDSNQNIVSGIAPIREYLRQEQRVGLGTDLSGGCEVSMLRVIASAIRCSKLKSYYEPEHSPYLCLSEAFYLATSGGADVFGAKPGFGVDDPLFALVLDDRRFDVGASFTIAQRLERAVYRADDRDLVARYAFGEPITLK